MKTLADDSFFQCSSMRMLSNQDGCRLYHGSSQKEVRLILIMQNPVCDQPLYIQAMFRGKVNANYHYRQEKSPYLGIEYIREGSLAVRQEKRCYLMEPGDVFLLQPDMDNEIMTGPEGFCVKDSFQIRGKLLNPFLVSTGLNRQDCILHFEWQRLERLLEQLQELSLKNDLNCFVANSLLTYEILELIAYPDRSAEPVPGITGLLEFIRSNLEKTLSMDILTKQSGLSELNLTKIFRSLYGKTPHQVLIKLRMEQAVKLLLSNPELSVKEIAQMVGYPNPMNFSTAFRLFYESCPRQYRRLRMDQAGFHISGYR